MKFFLYLFVTVLLLVSACKKTDTQTPTNSVVIKVDSTNLTLSGDASVVDSFGLQSSVSWKATITPSTATWLKLSETSGNANSKIKVTSTEANTTALRSATITITPQSSATGQPVSITVTQKVLGPQLKVDKTSINLVGAIGSKDSFNIQSITSAIKLRTPQAG